MSKLNVFWCDDQYRDKIENQEVYMDMLEELDIKPTFFKNSEQLFAALEKPDMSLHVDAVVFDFNLSNDKLIENPGDGKEKSGFLHVIRNMDSYIEKGIPFYLWSKRDENEIVNSLTEGYDLGKEYQKFSEYFLGERRRFFPGMDTFEETVKTLIEEVEMLKNPRYRLKVENPKLYDAAVKVSENCWNTIARALELEKDVEAQKGHMEEILNSMRCEVDNVMKLLGIPGYDNMSKDGIKLSTIDKLIGAEHIQMELVSHSLEDKALARGIKLILEFMQDGSHQSQNLKYNVREYLQQTKDYHLVLFLAHGLINIILWGAKALEYMEKNMLVSICKIREKIVIEEIPREKGKFQGVLELDENNVLHVGPCSFGNLKIGDMVVNSVEIRDNEDNNLKLNYPFFGFFRFSKKERP